MVLLSLGGEDSPADNDSGGVQCPFIPSCGKITQKRNATVLQPQGHRRVGEHCFLDILHGYDTTRASPMPDDNSPHVPFSSN